MASAASFTHVAGLAQFSPQCTKFRLTLPRIATRPETLAACWKFRWLASAGKSGQERGGVGDVAEWLKATVC
jgi:hypothetical protein